MSELPAILAYIAFGYVLIGIIVAVVIDRYSIRHQPEWTRAYLGAYCAQMVAVCLLWWWYLFCIVLVRFLILTSESECYD